MRCRSQNLFGNLELVIVMNVISFATGTNPYQRKSSVLLNRRLAGVPIVEYGSRSKSDTQDRPIHGTYLRIRKQIVEDLVKRRAYDGREYAEHERVFDVPTKALQRE